MDEIQFHDPSLELRYTYQGNPPRVTALAYGGRGSNYSRRYPGVGTFREIEQGNRDIGAKVVRNSRCLIVHPL